MGLLGGGAALGVGVLLGLLGGGGSILTVPVFVYLLGFEAKVAIASSLAVVGAVAVVGVIGHARAGNVDGRVALVFGSVAMVGTYGGARLAAFVPGGAQLALFAVVMLVAAAFMLRGRAPDPAGNGPKRGRRLGWIALEGVAVGVLTGLVGVGGGFLIVPALVLLGGLPMKQAVGTSLLVIALKSGAGVLGYLGQVAIPWGDVAGFTVLAAVGIVAGSALVRFVSQDALRRGFAVFLLVMGGAMLYQSRDVLLPGAPAAAEETRDGVATAPTAARPPR